MKPPYYKPMLPVNAGVGDNSEFIHEIKWDGFRAVAYLGERYVDLVSRGGHSWKERFPGIAGALGKIRQPAVLDGEIIALDQGGFPRFSLLQPQGQNDAQIIYVVFDLLFWQGKCICSLPWFKRRSLLEENIETQGRIMISPLLPGDAAAGLKFAEDNRLEGIVSKQRASPYLPGVRSPFWRKQKITCTLDCVVIGLSTSQSKIRSMAAALYESPGGDLRCVGNIGSGLGQRELVFLEKAAALLSIEECPAVNPPEQNSGLIWLKPHLVAEIEYLEFTPQGRLRHPVFLRFRFDKKAENCIQGVEQSCPNNK